MSDRMTMVGKTCEEMPDDNDEKGCLFAGLLDESEGLIMKEKDRRELDELSEDKNAISSLTSCVQIEGINPITSKTFLASGTLFQASGKVRYVITSASCFTFKDEDGKFHEYTDLTVYHQRKGASVYKEKMLI